MTEEIWKPVKGFEGLYEVSNLGKIKSIERKIQRENWGFLSVREKILKQNIGTTGYYQVSLWKNNKGHIRKVHRIVAEAFIPNIQNKRIVDHIDTNPLNNNATNLRWATDKENANNPLSIEKLRGTKKSLEHREKMRAVNLGKKMSLESRKKISESQKGKRKTKLWKKVICVETKKVFNSLSDASKETGLNIQNISAVCRGKRAKCGGYKWSYL